MTRKLAAYVLIGPIPHLLGYVVAPIAISRLGSRVAWIHGRPGPLNVVGVPFVLTGAVLLVGAMASHYEASPDDIQFTASPNYLARGGAYRRTRNPLYLGGGFLWAGWSLIFGSAAVVICGVILIGGLATLGVPFEERMLERKFGATYLAYKQEVPRWWRFARRRGR